MFCEISEDVVPALTAKWIGVFFARMISAENTNRSEKETERHFLKLLVFSRIVCFVMLAACRYFLKTLQSTEEDFFFPNTVKLLVTPKVRS